MQGGNGEYYVFADKEGNNIPVFSNNKQHKDAVIGGSMNSSTLKQVLVKIIGLYKA